MLATTEKLLEKGFGNQIIKDWNVASVFGGTAARRYALINKALRKGEVEQLCRGIYILSPKYRSPNISKFFIANRMVQGSYLSLETALSFHGWIPERVEMTQSVILKGRSRRFSTGLGEFNYVKIPIHEYEFLSGVDRKEVGGQAFLMASPLRALLDYIYIRKIEWKNLEFLLESMRIEMDHLESLTTENFEELMSVYRSKRVLDFLRHLKKELNK